MVIVASLASVPAASALLTCVPTRVRARGWISLDIGLSQVYMTVMSSRRRLEQQRARLAEQAPDLTQVLRGSLFERTRRCGVPTCHCATGGGHPVVGAISFAPDELPKARRIAGEIAQALRSGS